MIAAGVVGVLLLLIVVAMVGGRYYVASEGGRQQIANLLQGQKLSRYGRLNVYGVKGDLLDDFTIDRLTVTDSKGVWLDARNIRVDWSYWPLLSRRFHASDISADVIQLVRQPVLEPDTHQPSSPQPISIKIDKFAAKIELMEGFSKEYGRWSLNGDADIPRTGTKRATVNADSLNRPGDYLRLAASFGGKLEDTRLNLRANEAQGGPLAGSLGYSPNQPFSAVAVLNNEIVNARVQTGQFTPLTIRDSFGETGSRVAGYADFSGSELLAPFVTKVGRTARFGFAMLPTGDKAYQSVGWKLISDNVTSEASGLIRMSDRSAPGGVKLDIQTASLSRLVGSDVAGPAAYSGVFKGDASNWTLQDGVRIVPTAGQAIRAGAAR